LTEVSLLQRLARERFYDLMVGRDGVWRGTCPNCGRMPPVSNRAFEVWPDFFHCVDCGIHGDVVCLVMNNDGLTVAEEQTLIARRGRMLQ